jgi:hypothetical protein
MPYPPNTRVLHSASTVYEGEGSREKMTRNSNDGQRAFNLRVWGSSPRGCAGFFSFYFAQLWSCTARPESQMMGSMAIGLSSHSPWATGGFCWPLVDSLQRSLNFSRNLCNNRSLSVRLWGAGMDYRYLAGGCVLNWQLDVRHLTWSIWNSWRIYLHNNVSSVRCGVSEQVELHDENNCLLHNNVIMTSSSWNSPSNRAVMPSIAK